MKQRRPQGDSVTATVVYKKWVLERMEERGCNRAELARRLKYPDKTPVSSASISNFLGKDGEPLKPTRTRLIPLINAALGGTPPQEGGPASDDLAIVVAGWPYLTAEERAFFTSAAKRAKKP